MHSFADVAKVLTLLPANESQPGIFAGLSFALNRHFSPYEPENETSLIAERLHELCLHSRELASEKFATLTAHRSMFGKLAADLEKMAMSLDVDTSRR